MPQWPSTAPTKTTTSPSTSRRTHIHLMQWLPKDRPRSGMRTTSELALWFDILSATQDGIHFYMSRNNVICTKGNHKGTLSLKYLKSVQVLASKETLPASEGPPLPSAVLDAIVPSRFCGPCGCQSLGPLQCAIYGSCCSVQLCHQQLTLPSCDNWQDIDTLQTWMAWHLDAEYMSTTLSMQAM